MSFGAGAKAGDDPPANYLPWLALVVIFLSMSIILNLFFLFKIKSDKMRKKQSRQKTLGQRKVVNSIKPPPNIETRIKNGFKTN